MFDLFRNFGRSEREKQQETLSAYLDGELAPAERDRLEAQLALDKALQDELAEMQVWQQQMRDLPTRRVPRNFTLDPALYGRPQRQFLGSAYPALRTATALTAFLLVIALAVNVYMNSFLGGAVSQTALAPAFEPASMVEEAAEEPALAQITRVVTETVVEEGITVEAEMAVEEEMAAEGAPAPPATPFMLESSIDKETEAAEAPVEIAEVEEAPMADAAVEEASPELEVRKADDAVAEELKQELSEALEFIEGTAEAPPPADVPFAADEVTAPEEVVTGEGALPATNVPDLAEEQQLLPAVEETAPETQILPPVGLEEIILALGLLFIFLTVLTLIARRRR
jgi:hypothetical protein